MLRTRVVKLGNSAANIETIFRIALDTSGTKDSVTVTEKNCFAYNFSLLRPIAINLGLYEDNVWDILGEYETNVNVTVTKDRKWFPVNYSSLFRPILIKLDEKEAYIYILTKF